jgi:hypothetical protein
VTRQLRWHEKLRRRKSEGGAGIPFPPTPFPSRPARAEKFSALPPAGRQLKLAVRIFVKKSSDFVQKVPPIFKIRILGDCCLAPPKAGLGFRRDFEGKFEVAKQFLPAQTEVQFAKGKHEFEKFINQSFFFRRRRKAKR